MGWHISKGTLSYVIVEGPNGGRGGEGKKEKEGRGREREGELREEMWKEQGKKRGREKGRGYWRGGVGEIMRDERSKDWREEYSSVVWLCEELICLL